MKLEKVTDHHGRWYADACGAAFGLELMGERWSGLVLRELMLGPRRFTDLRFALPGISARVLTERLAGLETAGLVQREGDRLYGLTRWGYQAEPILLGLCRWALMSPDRDMSLAISPVALMLSLRALILPDRAAEVDMACTIAIARESFALYLRDGEVMIRRGEGEGQFALHAPNTAPLKRFIFGKAPLATLPDIALTGHASMAMVFAGCFALPAMLERGSTSG